MQLDFKIDENTEPTLTVNGIKPLLEIVFINLFKNAALYSDNAGVNVFIRETAYELHVMLENNGSVISDEDQKKLFEAFMRGQNSQNISGSGLGLKIVQRILEYHKAQISYEAVSGNRNVFTIIFPTHSIKSKF